MIRDRGPISSLGFGVTSRDVPLNETEREGPSANSGIVAKALNGHPVMRFFAHATATMAGAYVAGKVIKGGGVKLATKIQRAADGGGQYAGSATRFVESAGKIKKALDELEGVHRSIDGVDPTDVYSKLVFEIDGRRANQNLDRLVGGTQIIQNQHINTREVRAATGGITREPAVVWSLRDDIQQTLARRARNLAVELPALYLTQRAVTDPLFGENQDKRKVHWYNPVDVIADFSKQTTINIASMLTPFDLGGAGLARVKFLANAPFSKNPNLRLSANQTKFSNAFVDIKTVLGEFGQDAAKVLTGITRQSTAIGAAFKSAVTEGGAAEGGIVFAMQQARRGSRIAGEEADTVAGMTLLKKAGIKAKAYILGHQVSDGTSPDANQQLQGLADAMPSLKGVTLGSREFIKRYKAGKQAYDVLSGAISYDEALNSVRGIKNVNSPKDLLTSSIKSIRELHSSKFTDFSNSLIVARGTGDTLNRGEFYKEVETNEYKKNLYQQLVRQGVNEQTASSLVQKIGLDGVPTSFANKTNISQRILFGNTKIIDDNDTGDFVEQMLERAKKLEKIDDPTLTNDALTNSLELTDILFAQREFRARLDRKVGRSFNATYDQVILGRGRSLVRGQKISYQDFEGDLTPEKADYLARSVADTMGIDLLDAEGRKLSRSVISDRLARRGIDYEDVGQLRSYLIDQKKMTSPIFGDGYNIFGMKSLLVDEAFSSGFFSYLNEDQESIVSNLASDIARTDPISSTIGYSELKGVYRTRSGETLDLTRIVGAGSRALDFVREQLQIPVIKFNPLDMMGQGGPQGIDKRNMFQFTEGFSFQPFGGLSESSPGLYIFSQEKRGFFGPTGSLFQLTGDRFNDPVITKLSGQFRQMPTTENDMFSRTAKRVAERQTVLNLPEGATAEDDSSFLGRIKKRLDIAEEQPNSILRYFNRFRERRESIDNPAVFARLFTPEGAVGKKGRLRLRSIPGADDLEAPRLSVVNESGDEIYSHTQVLQAYEGFRRKFQSYGTPLPVIREFERKNPGVFRSVLDDGTELNLSEARTEADLRAIAVAELSKVDETVVDARGSRIDSRSLTASAGVVRNQLSRFSLEEVSPKSVQSPTISTRMDELRESIFQMVLQRRAYNTAIGTGGSIDPGRLAVDIEEIVSDLVRRKIISSNQAAEARAAGFSSVVNFAAFAGYRRSGTESENLSRGLSTLLGLRDSPTTSNSISSLVQPFVTQKIANVGTAGFGNDILSLFRPMVTRNLKPAPYKLNDLSVNPLGNEGTVYVPTFSTVLDQVGAKRAIKSAIGYSTYDDAEAFSAASIASSHYVERLNSTFETFGLGLNASNYKGPMSLFTMGMVGKRVAPLVVGGTALMTADRTIGGVVNEKDERGERVYSPYFGTKLARGAVETQSLISGVVPGGMSYSEKREQLMEGEVPVRQGRYWPLGVTPFEGGKIMYYRPSYYRRMKAGASYTSESMGSPLERLAFGYDFSPLRPFDPYRFERKHYEDRPYPVTGEYFSGPWGPITPLLNATVGKVLKPQITMHKEELARGLANYVSAGQGGSYDPSGLIQSGKVFLESGNQYPVSGQIGYQTNPVQASQFSGGSTTLSLMASGSAGGAGQISNYNQSLSSAGAMPLGTAAATSFRTISNLNSRYIQASQYGPPPVPGSVPPRIVAAGEPVAPNRIGIGLGEIGYRAQEMGGIYGFGFASLREKFGFGQGDFEPQRSLLQSASKAYGSGRAFWDLNLGGLGDIPIKPEGALGNIELSEITRRFIPKERTNVDYLNPIANTMGKNYPFLPGSNYFINFKQGDPFVKVQEGELRLPGIGYERLNPSMPGYGDRLTQLDILSDVAPYSKEFRSLNNQMSMASVDPGQRKKLDEIRAQVEQTTQKKQFSEYKYKYSTKEELGISRGGMMLGRMGEYLAHRDTFINTKILPNKTAQEDWESRNVYGSTFPEWQNPIESFIKPMYFKAQGRNPLASGLLMAGVGAAFGKTATARTLGSVAGFTTGAGYSMYSKAKQRITGERFIPEERKKQMALEEYTDILSYVKNTNLSNEAKEAGDMAAAAQFSQAAKRTMYGADIYGASVDTLSLAIPKRKREHFKSMINAPVQERERILSTAPRLERRIYEAAWGMKVEEKPDLAEYFSRHELPDQSWEGWHPNTNMEHVKIKMGQSMGINMSQMGYYPQQVREAQMTNPSYPSYNQNSNQEATAAQIRMMMSRNNISGNVIPVLNGSGSSGVDIFSGVR